jgi:acyl carrier protein
MLDISCAQGYRRLAYVSFQDIMRLYEIYQKVRPELPSHPRMNKQARIANIVETLTGKPLTIAPDDSLFESGVLDSFALTDMVGSLEKEFSIQVPDADLTPRKFDSIARIAAYLDSRS